MPGDIRDPEVTPWHYDPRYEQNRPIQIAEPGIDDYLQTIAIDTIGVRISPEKLGEIKNILDDKGFFHRNMGDEDFRKEFVKHLKNIKMAKRMIQKWQI